MGDLILLGAEAQVRGRKGNRSYSFDMASGVIVEEANITLVVMACRKKKHLNTSTIYKKPSSTAFVAAFGPS
jgi:hypothetical protein